jgi:hypothetical protein
MRGFYISLCNLIGLVYAAPAFLAADRRGNITLPENDKFYAAPVGYESKAPGTILQYRRAPRSISLDNKSPLKLKEAWQIQYRTQNSIGEPEAGTVTLLIPYEAKTKNLFAQGYFSDAAYNGQASPFFFLFCMQVGGLTNKTGVIHRWRSRSVGETTMTLPECKQLS